jgi:class 3 adenylate cyclase
MMGRDEKMITGETSTTGRTFLTQVKPDVALRDLQVVDWLPTVQREGSFSISDVEILAELLQAYQASLCLQNILRPLIPKMTWYQATGVAQQWQDKWPTEELVATIMFTDIAGFTPLMEAHPVREVLDSLNDYFALLSRIVQKRRGDVHKFLGDGLMALFVCPSDAVKAGREIQQAVAKFNARQEARELCRFETRLAIDVGKVVLTSVGSYDRRDHTLIGQPVNRAAHLAEDATPGTVWVSKHAYEKLGNRDEFAVRTMSVANSEGHLTAVYEVGYSCRE